MPAIKPIDVKWCEDNKEEAIRLQNCLHKHNKSGRDMVVVNWLNGRLLSERYVKSTYDGQHIPMARTADAAIRRLFLLNNCRVSPPSYKTVAFDLAKHPVGSFPFELSLRTTTAQIKWLIANGWSVKELPGFCMWQVVDALKEIVNDTPIAINRHLRNTGKTVRPSWENGVHKEVNPYAIVPTTLINATINAIKLNREITLERQLVEKMQFTAELQETITAVDVNRWVEEQCGVVKKRFPNSTLTIVCCLDVDVLFKAPEGVMVYKSTNHHFARRIAIFTSRTAIEPVNDESLGTLSNVDITDLDVMNIYDGKVVRLPHDLYIDAIDVTAECRCSATVNYDF